MALLPFEEEDCTILAQTPYEQEAQGAPRRLASLRSTQPSAFSGALKAAPAPTTLNVPLLALACRSACWLTGYLSFPRSAEGSVQGCAAGGGCDAVLSSQWSTMLGLPTSLWGCRVRGPGGYRVRQAAGGPVGASAFTVVAFRPLLSVYLTVVAVTMLGAACPYCLTSLALMAAITALLVKQRPASVAARPWMRIAGCPRRRDRLRDPGPARELRHAGGRVTRP